MWNTLFVAWVPLLMIIATPVIQIVLCAKKLANKITLPLYVITLLCLIIGTILPFLATLISMYALPAGTKCATGSVAFVFLGWMFTVFCVPLIGIISYIIFNMKSRSVASQ